MTSQSIQQPLDGLDGRVEGGAQDLGTECDERVGHENVLRGPGDRGPGGHGQHEAQEVDGAEAAQVDGRDGEVACSQALIHVVGGGVQLKGAHEGARLPLEAVVMPAGVQHPGAGVRAEARVGNARDNPARRDVGLGGGLADDQDVWQEGAEHGAARCQGRERAEDLGGSPCRDAAHAVDYRQQGPQQGAVQVVQRQERRVGDRACGREGWIAGGPG